MTSPPDRGMELLLGHLAAQRGHVLGILDGLSDEQLRRPLLPSGWHCLGLVSHLTVGVERYWFHCVVAGAPLGDLSQGGAADWRVAPGEPAAAVFGRYRAAIRTSDAVLAAADPDAAPARPDPVWHTWDTDFPDVRSVVAHVVTETAVHAGHLDAVRELVDGRQWIIV